MLKRVTPAVLTLLLFLLPTLVAAHGHKMVIQVATKDGVSQKMALMNAKNLKTMLGKEAVDVEIVVFGPGLGLLEESSWSADRVKALMKDYGVKFSVCEGTLKAYAKRHNGKVPDLVAGAKYVPTGAFRILQLQEQGYAYMRP